jgi:hypothetical protein
MQGYPNPDLQKEITALQQEITAFQLDITALQQEKAARWEIQMVKEKRAVGMSSLLFSSLLFIHIPIQSLR